MALTDTWIKANHNKERSKAAEKTDRDGLSARLSPKGKPLLRPIIPEAEILIKDAMALSEGGPYLFNNAGAPEPMGKGAPLQLPYNIMQWLRRHEKYEMEHWSVHDLRKTARTNWSTLTDPHIAEIMLGHRLPGDWQVYDHYDYLAEQKAAYAAWWERLMTLIA